MTRYAALLRGVNVGSARRLAMADLRALVEGLGYTHATTVLNSGNVLFRGTGPAATVAGRLEAAIAAHAGFRSRVFVETLATLDGIIAENPLVARSDPSRLHVAFVSSATALVPLAALLGTDWRPEALAIGSRAAYFCCPAGISQGQVVEAAGRLLGDRTTLRAWSTVLRMRTVLAAL